METVKDPIHEKIARAYPPSVGADIVVYIQARKEMGFYTDKLGESLLDSRIVRFVSGLRESRYNSDIAIALGLINWQDSKLFGSALRLAELMRKYPEESMHTLSSLSEITAMNIRLRNQAHSGDFDSLAEKASGKIGGLWKKGKIERAMELADRMRPFTDGPAGRKSAVDCVSDLNEIARVFEYGSASKNDATNAEAGEPQSHPGRQDEIYRKERYDAYELDPLSKKALAELLRRDGTPADVAQRLNEGPNSVDRAMASLSKRGLVGKNRFGIYSATGDGALYARQQGLQDEDLAGGP